MKHALKLALICFATASFIPVAVAKPIENVQARITYNADASPGQIYHRARMAIRKACKLSSEIGPVRQAQNRTCVLPMLDDFVARVGNPDLLALHETRTGRQVSRTHLASR